MEKIANLVVPLAGKAQRFLDLGFKMPKPLIMAGDRMIIDRTMECVNYSQCNLIFVVRAEHISNFSIDKILQNKFGTDIKIVVAHKDTAGSVSSVLLAKELIDNDLPLIVHCSDVWFETKRTGVYEPANTIKKNVDGMLLTFKANSSNYSYTECDAQGKVVRTAEKTVISNYANCGIYYFKSGKLFIQAANDMISSQDTTKGEYFIAPLYNYLRKITDNIVTEEVSRMHIFGTPQELDFYVNCTLNKFGVHTTVALCCDHSGWDLKEATKKILDRRMIKYIDYGCYTSQSSDYVDFAELAAEAIEKKICTHAMAFCHTGGGQNMVGNKHKNIRGVLIFDTYTAHMAIEHNCANWFSVPTRTVNEKLMDEMIASMQSASFEGGRHQNRVQKVHELL